MDARSDDDASAERGIVDRQVVRTDGSRATTRWRSTKIAGQVRAVAEHRQVIVPWREPVDDQPVARVLELIAIHRRDVGPRVRRVRGAQEDRGPPASGYAHTCSVVMPVPDAALEIGRPPGRA